MTSRLHSKHRCSHCRINRYLCFCEHIPSLDLATEVTILMHKAEVHLTSNTATLARKCLLNADIRTRGVENSPMNLDDLEDGFTTNLVLFPWGNAEVLTPEYIKELKGKVRLIVPDGSWSQAKRIMKREAVLRKMTKVILPPGPPSTYRLREEPTPESVSTFEAIARALGLFHGQEVQAKLEKIFTIMVERNLWAKSLIHESDCTFPIPEKAIFHKYNPLASEE